MPPLEDEHGFSGPGEIGGGGQTVMATANDNDVVAHRWKSYYGPPEGGHYDLHVTDTTRFHQGDDLDGSSARRRRAPGEPGRRRAQRAGGCSVTTRPGG